MMLALGKVRDADSQMSERWNFLMQCAEKKTNMGGGGKKKKEKIQLLGTKWEKHPAPRAVAAAFLRSASVQVVSVTFAVRFLLLSLSSS